MHFKPAQLRASPPGMWLGDFCPAGKKRDFTTSLTFSGHAERKVEKFMEGKKLRACAHLPTVELLVFASHYEIFAYLRDLTTVTVFRALQYKTPRCFPTARLSRILCSV